MTESRFNCPIICPTLPEPGELAAEMQKIFASGRVTVGEQVSAFETAVRSKLGVRHAIAVSSGTSGLMLLIRALNLPAGSEVITPTFTFAATSHALLWNGLKPVFCDSEPGSYTMDVSAAEELITEKTSAIYPVCIFGVPGEIDAYQKLADKYGLALFFDSAQGLGSTYHGRMLGNFGMGEVFSLSPTKVVTAMEGGIIATNDDDLAEKTRHMRDYGKAADGEDMVLLGLSARMAEVNALVGSWSLNRVDAWIANRSRIVERYKERLGEIPGVGFQAIPSQCTSSLNYMTILMDPDRLRLTRDELHARLKSEGIQTKRYFYPALHNQTLYSRIDPECPPRLRIAEQISSRCLALPMYSHMPMETVDRICSKVVDILR